MSFWHAAALLGSLRRLRKNLPRAAAWWTCGLLVASLNGRAVAAGGRVESRCARLSTAQYEELDARLQLLLRTEAPGRSLPSIVCDSEGTFLEWEGERYPIPGRGALVDEAVDVIEARLLEEARQRESARGVEDAAVAQGEPVLEPGQVTDAPAARTGRPADRTAFKPSDAKGGGVSIGVEVETGTDTMSLPVGPAFDFVSTMGPLLVGGREAFRFADDDASLLFMDFEASVGYGAPFNPDKPLGIFLRFGAEWMISYPEGNSGQASAVPIAGLALRGAKSFGFVSFWAGIDARFRLMPLRLGVHEARDVSGGLSLGLTFVDWSRR